MLPIAMPPDDAPVRVLVVERDPASAEMAATFLQRGHERMVTSAASDPTAVLERLEAGAFDGVLAAYDMPAVDGLELLSVVRDAYPDLPFVLFTAEGDEEVASAAVSAGVTEYVRRRAGGDQFGPLADDIVAMVDERESSPAALAHSG